MMVKGQEHPTHQQLTKHQRQIQLKLSTILKEKISDFAQAYGSFFDKDGKYCALAALVKYFGYDLAATEKIKNGIITLASDLIPPDIIEMIEGFSPYGRLVEYPRCSCRKPNYYNYTIISMLIHLNDYHHMTFTQIGNWLESKGM